MSIPEEAGKVSTAAITAMRSTPLAIALLLVNIGFLGFAGYVLGEVAENAKTRNQQQMDIIIKLISDLKDCGRGAQGSRTRSIIQLPLEDKKVKNVGDILK